ncbi:MAG: hypothetical protein HOP95_11870 [Sphingomonas sp.]|nr:hypothetical protein [Sphingomonas sp.]
MPKLSLSRAWEETTRVLARDGRLFLAVALALFVLPGLILNVTMPEGAPGSFPGTGLWIAVGFVALIVSLVGQLAVIRLAIGPHVAVGEAIMHGLKRLFPYVACVLVWVVPILVVGSVLYNLVGADQAHPPVAAALGLIILTIVGVYVGVRMMLTSAVASAEQVGPLVILRRSWDMSHGNWWRLFVFLLLFGIGALCLIWAVDSVAGLLVRVVAADAGPRSLGGLLVSIVSQLVSALLSVVFFVMLARIYVQLSGSEAATPTVPRSGT